SRRLPEQLVGVLLCDQVIRRRARTLLVLPTAPRSRRAHTSHPGAPRTTRGGRGRRGACRRGRTHHSRPRDTASRLRRTRPRTARRARPGTARRARPGTARRARPGTARRARPGTAGRPRARTRRSRTARHRLARIGRIRPRRSRPRRRGVRRVPTRRRARGVALILRRVLRTLRLPLLRLLPRTGLTAVRLARTGPAAVPAAPATGPPAPGTVADHPLAPRRRRDVRRGRGTHRRRQHRNTAVDRLERLHVVVAHGVTGRLLHLRLLTLEIPAVRGPEPGRPGDHDRVGEGAVRLRAGRGGLRDARRQLIECGRQLLGWGDVVPDACLRSFSSRS